MYKRRKFWRDVGSSLVCVALCAGTILAAFVSCSAESDEVKEECIFSFVTLNGKTLSFSTGESDGVEYLVYRLVADSSVELEFPSEPKGSFKKFFYSFYFRGGGAANEGLDLNSVSFRNGEYRYEVYQEYSAQDSSTRVGVRVTNEQTGKEFEIQGRPETVKGSLVDFRFDERIPR